jgi:transposase-like protein
LPRKTPKEQHKKRQLKPRTRPPRYRYSVRTDTGPIALQAFWGMHVEAMNWSGIGVAEYAAALGLSPHSPRILRDRLEQSGNEMDLRSLLHPSARAQLSSAAYCVGRKYRLTAEQIDGRSHRRRFSDEQKRVIVQETDEPGVTVAQVCRRHGVATTSMVFRWRTEFGLTLPPAFARAQAHADHLAASPASETMLAARMSEEPRRLAGGEAPQGVSATRLARNLHRRPRGWRRLAPKRTGRRA